jgi:xanthine/uracil permease
MLHFCIAGIVVTTYFVASRRLPALTRRPVVYGPLYGWLVWAVMNYVVVPLSAVAMPALTLPRLINGLGIHAFGVGLRSALFARVASQTESSGSVPVS